MTNSKARTAIANSVVGLTRYLVRSRHLSKERAYLKLYQTELFGLLNNIKSGLFLEPNDQLIELLRAEEREGASGLYERLARI